MRLELGIDANNLDVMTAFWARALGYVRGYNDDENYRDLLPPDGNGATVFVQRVPEVKVAKNRIHIDIYEIDPQPKINDLIAAGATRVGGPVDEDGWWWQIMTDPEGNEFCVCKDVPGRKPAATTR